MSVFIAEVLLFATGAAALTANFTSEAHRQNTRDANMAMAFCHWFCIVLLVFNALDYIYIVMAIATSVLVVIGVKLYNQRTEWPIEKRTALFQSKRFRVTVIASIVAAVLLALAQFVPRKFVLTANQHPYADTLFVLPSGQELDSRAKWDSLKKLKP